MKTFGEIIFGTLIGLWVGLFVVEDIALCILGLCIMAAVFCGGWNWRGCIDKKKQRKKDA